MPHLLEKKCILIVGFGLEVSPESGLGVNLHKGKIIAAVIDDEKGYIVADDLSTEADTKKQAENQEAVIAPFIVSEPPPASPAGAQVNCILSFHACLHREMRFRQSGYSTRPKLIRGSTIT